MIIVTGEPRSGTSLVMQTLVLLGFVPLGVKFPRGRNKNQNTQGFWESIDTLRNNFSHIAEHDNETCAKIDLRKFLDNPHTSIDNKIIVCTRNITVLANAQINVGFSENLERTINRITRNYNQLQEFLNNNNNIPVLQIGLVNFRNNPAQTVDSIISFVTPPIRGRQAAIDNVILGGE